MIAREVGVWIAVVFMAIAGIALFKLLMATRIGDAAPGFRNLAAAI